MKGDKKAGKYIHWLWENYPHQGWIYFIYQLVHFWHFPMIDRECSWIANPCFLASSNIFRQILCESKLIILWQDVHFICSWWWLVSLNSYNSPLSPRVIRRKIPISRKSRIVRKTLARPSVGNASSISWDEKICFWRIQSNISFRSRVILFHRDLRITDISIIDTKSQKYIQLRIKVKKK
jgi:hypothetical protein